MNDDDRAPTLDELLKLRRYLEEALAWKRREQRLRRASKLHVRHPWIDDNINKSVMKTTRELQFLDQVISERGASCGTEEE
jgi:hypothetical protein